MVEYNFESSDFSIPEPSENPLAGIVIGGVGVAVGIDVGVISRNVGQGNSTARATIDAMAAGIGVGLATAGESANTGNPLSGAFVAETAIIAAVTLYAGGVAGVLAAAVFQIAKSVDPIRSQYPNVPDSQLDSAIAISAANATSQAIANLRAEMPGVSNFDDLTLSSEIASILDSTNEIESILGNLDALYANPDGWGYLVGGQQGDPNAHNADYVPESPDFTGSFPSGSGGGGADSGQAANRNPSSPQGIQAAAEEAMGRTTGYFGPTASNTSSVPSATQATYGGRDGMSAAGIVPGGPGDNPDGYGSPVDGPNGNESSDDRVNVA